MSDFRRSSNFRRALAGAVMTLTAMGAGAEPMQDLSVLRQVAQAWLADAVADRYGSAGQANVSAPDARLRLRPCSRTPEAFLAPGASLETTRAVGVQCAGPQPWKVFLPATVEVTASVVVASRALSRGTILAAQDLTRKPMDVARLTGAFIDNPEQAIGQELARSLAPGVALAPGMLKRRTVVARGEPVMLLSGRGGIQVQVEARALEDGALGQRIEVENARSQRRVQAVVTGRGQVRVGG